MPGTLVGGALVPGPLIPVLPPSPRPVFSQTRVATACCLATCLQVTPIAESGECLVASACMTLIGSRAASPTAASSQQQHQQQQQQQLNQKLIKGQMIKKQPQRLQTYPPGWLPATSSCSGGRAASCCGTSSGASMAGWTAGSAPPVPPSMGPGARSPPWTAVPWWAGAGARTRARCSCLRPPVPMAPCGCMNCQPVAAVGARRLLPWAQQKAWVHPQQQLAGAAICRLRQHSG